MNPPPDANNYRNANGCINWRRFRDAAVAWANSLPETLPNNLERKTP